MSISDVYGPGNVSKALIISDDKTGHRRNISTVSEVQSANWSGQTAGIYVRELQANFDLVTGDLTADDGVTCLVDTAGNRFKVVTVAGTISDEILAAFSSKAEVEAAAITPEPNYLNIAGYTTAGDGGAARYIRVVSEPSHDGKIQSLDGAWWEIAEPAISLPQLGAVGDDATDNATTIDAAIGAADALGLPLDVPAGIFRTSGAHSLPASLSIRGGGKFRSILRTTSTTATVLSTDGNGVSIKALGFDSSVTRSAGSYLDVTHGLFEISDFRMDGPFIGINLHSGSRTILFENGEIVDAVPTTGTSMKIHNSGTDVSMNDMVFTITDVGARPATHLEIDLLGDLSMNDVQLYGAVNNVVLDPGSSESISSLKCVNVWFDGAGSNGLLIQPSSTGTIKRSTFEACWFGGCANAGVNIFPIGASTDVDGIDFSNCEFLGNTVAGLFTGGDDVIKNLHINSGRVAGNGTYGLLLDGVLSGAVQDTRIGQSGGFGVNGTGLYLAGAADNLNVTGIDLRGNTTAVTNTATGTNIRFKNVVGYEAAISPSQITSNQNDYLPTGGHAADTWRVSTDASRNVTGVVAPGYGKELLLENIGSFNFVLVNASVSSTAANRFLFGGDVIVPPNFAARLKYDATSARWRLVSLSAALGTAASKDIGTSGGAVPLLNTANTWSMDQVIQGRLGVGAAGIDSRVAVTIGPTLASAGDVFGLFMGYASLGPGSGFSAYFQYVGGGAVATGGNTIAAAYGLFSEAMTKSGGGTVTNSYSGYFKKSALATNNYGIYTDGESGIGANPTAAAWLALGAGTTTKSQINLASSAAPTSPANGDFWFDGSALKIRIGGVTKTVTVS